MEKIKLVEATQLKSGIPDFAPGDTINVTLYRGGEKMDVKVALGER